MDDQPGATLLEKVDSTSLRSYRLPIDPQLRTDIDDQFFPPHSDFCLAWACPNIVHAYTSFWNLYI